jgi:hypothetical protein
MKIDQRTSENLLEPLALSPLSFISAGVACFAFSLLDNLGLIDRLIAEERLDDHDLKSFPNRLVIKSAIITLAKNGIFAIVDGSFSLTDFGRQIVDHRGSIGLIYDGYRYVLANQVKYAQDEPSSPLKRNVDWKAVANASIPFGEKTIDPIVIGLIDDLKIKGTICDLGCGACTRLIRICQMARCKGLGIEFADAAIKLAKGKIKRTTQVSVQKGDVMSLKETWPDVEMIMQFFVMHDIAPDERCRRAMDSYIKNFPNVKYFIYADIVAPSQAVQTQLPGFDYVHSLLGIRTKTYEETQQIFEKSKFHVVREISVPNLPNTFIWVLQPHA